MIDSPDLQAGSTLRRDNAQSRSTALGTSSQLLLVFVLALIVRAAVGMYQFSRSGGADSLEFPDEQQYWLMAQSLAAGNGLRDELGFCASRMPLYPGLLALVSTLPHGVAITKIVQWVIAAGTAVLTCMLAARLLRTDRAEAEAQTSRASTIARAAPFVAGLLVAVDPFLALTSSLLLTETLYTFLQLALCVTAVPCLLRIQNLTWSRWIFLGFIATACIYVRESSVAFVAMLLGILWIANRFALRTLIGILVVLGVVVAAIFPWAYRNNQRLGEWHLLTTRGGISLYDGVRPGATGASDLGEVKQMPAVAGLSETAWDHYFRTESRRLVKSDPARIARLAVAKLKRTWNPVPNVDAYRSAALRLISAGWNIPTFILAGLGAVVLFRRGSMDSRAAMFLLLPALYVTVLHSIFVGSVRYRLVAMPSLEILTAVGLVWLGVIIRSRPVLRSELRDH